MNEYQRIVSHSIRAVVDNHDEHLLTQIQAAVIERIRYGSGYPETDAETYRDMYAARPEEIADNVRDVVADTILAACDATPDSLGDVLLRDLMDLGDRGIWTDVAESYVPTPDDYEAAL